MGNVTIFYFNSFLFTLLVDRLSGDLYIAKVPFNLLVASNYNNLTKALNIFFAILNIR